MKLSREIIGERLSRVRELVQNLKQTTSSFELFRKIEFENSSRQSFVFIELLLLLDKLLPTNFQSIEVYFLDKEKLRTTYVSTLNQSA